MLLALLLHASGVQFAPQSWETPILCVCIAAEGVRSGGAEPRPGRLFDFCCLSAELEPTPAA
eukprot:8080183-Alexandrium_andersonii.AAC.1